MIKKLMILGVVCLFLVACGNDRVEIISDCSEISEKNGVRMDEHYMACKAGGNATSTCSAEAIDMYCEKRIIEYSEDGSVKSIHNILDGINISLE